MEPMRRVALGIIKNGNGEVLIVHQIDPEKGDNATLSWRFPGGELKESETPEDAVKR
jgi:ADP-ribose pyrophosphatase YjhB (NUDIX family)